MRLRVGDSGEAVYGAESLRLARELQPDVVLMDLVIPGMDGITATKVLRREMPSIEVLTLAGMPSDDYLFAGT